MAAHIYGEFARLNPVPESTIDHVSAFYKYERERKVKRNKTSEQKRIEKNVKQLERYYRDRVSVLKQQRDYRAKKIREVK
jgi:hypothetical protein